MKARKKASAITDRHYYPTLDKTYQASAKLQEAEDRQRAYKESIKLCKESLKSELIFSAAYVFISYLYRDYAKKHSSTLENVKKAMGNDQDNEYDWVELGRVYVEQHNVREAASSFLKAVTLDPHINDLEPYARLLSVFQKLNNMRDQAADALMCLQRAGVGLEPSEERKWSQMVMETDLQNIREK